MRSHCCVCVSVYPPIVARHRLGKNLIAARQRLGKYPPIVARQRLSRNVTHGYLGLRAERPGFDSWHGQEISLLHRVQTGSGAHPASYPMGIGGSFPGGKVAGA
jgi:hypothetical protein